MAFRKILRHPLSPIARRSAYALFAIFVVMVIGTVGVKEMEGYDWVYSFFFMSMVATGQGPPTPNITGSTALIFVSVMAFISTGTVITSIGVIFGPFFGYLIHKGVRFSERELEKLQLEKKKGKGKEEELGGGER
jgi:hypothetical protein